MLSVKGFLPLTSVDTLFLTRVMTDAPFEAKPISFENFFPFNTDIIQLNISLKEQPCNSFTLKKKLQIH